MSSREAHEERSLVLLKTDAVQRSLVGEIIKRFEQKGLKITGMKMVWPTEEQLLDHYNKDDAWYQRKGEGVVEDLKSQGRDIDKEAIEYGKDIIRTVVRYMTESPVVALVLQGNQAVSIVTRTVGTTEPTTADIGTIRGDYSIDSYSHATLEDRGVKNLIHQSESVEEAEREVQIWFDDKEIHDYATAQERVMYEAIKLNKGE
ncbi:MAG: nucleoside-diphosphate kinase [Patescibacteria group bacterium]